MKKIVFLYVGVFLAMVLFSFWCIYGSIDPDFGWHLRTGQLILDTGVPMQDWYSYTMPNFPWVDHEWLMDVFIYITYSQFGFYFLLICFLSFYSLTFFIIRRKNQGSWEFFVPMTFGYLATIVFLGIRPQLFTAFFVAILIYLINKFLERSSRLFFLLPLLFILWVNLHAGFFIGLAILLAVLLVEIVKKTNLKILNNFNCQQQDWSKIKILGIVFLFATLVTFINPYGVRIYEEVFRTTADGFLRFHIAEWMPLFFTGFNVFIYLYLSVFVGFLIMFWRKVELNNLFLSVVFILLSLSSIRNFMLFAVITIPVFCDMIYYLKQQSKIDLEKYRKKIKKAVYVSVFLLIVTIAFYGYSNWSRNSINRYPEKALSFLKNISVSENIYNEYGWGGYLIWKLPERKYFIDGRMPSWRQDDMFVFGDYIKISNAELGFDKILQKYDVKFALISKKYEQSLIKSKKQDPEVRTFLKKHKWLAQILGASVDNNLYEELTNLGWKTIYKDDIAIILQK